MAAESTKRAKRLIAFREHRRDVAGSAVAVARAHRQRADSAVQATEKEMGQELERVRKSIGQPLFAADLNLINGCFQAAAGDLTERQAALHKAEETLDQKTSVLLDAHRQVRQMEAFLDLLEQRQLKLENIREQRSQDDLAVLKESVQ